jgi:hypothetical protein
MMYKFVGKSNQMYELDNDTIKLNYKCKEGTAGEGFSCGLKSEVETLPSDKYFKDKNISTEIRDATIAAYQTLVKMPNRETIAKSIVSSDPEKAPAFLKIFLRDVSSLAGMRPFIDSVDYDILADIISNEQAWK